MINAQFLKIKVLLSLKSSCLLFIDNGDCPSTEKFVLLCCCRDIALSHIFSPFGLNLFKRDDVFGSEGVRVLEDCCRCREDWASILVGKVVFILSQQSQEFDPIES
uniref:J0919 protein n=1 Tax=Saccharomyces cerevisiae TaxID=4932 RepID=E9PA68_YEASX|nr:J0919 [Saccharomyces cerevisiae]